MYFASKGKMLTTRNILRKPIIKLPHFMKQSSFSLIHNWTVEEVRIPVPWGHIAGKWWGPQDKRPILGLHGWQDNCGTFDTLIPYLDPRIGILTIDFPGHGLSSHIPPGAFYHLPDYIILVKRIIDYFKWPKVSLMGHSLGGITSFLYSTIFSDTVDFLICFDALKPLTFSNKKISRMGKDIDSFIKYDHLNCSNNEPPSYSFEELEVNLHKGSGKSISLEACKHILQRGILPSGTKPNKYYYNRDVRLKILSLLDYNRKDVVEYAQKVTCPTILCLASHRSSRYKSLIKADDVYDVIHKYNKNFEVHKVEGPHHVHLNNPERVEKFVNAFVNKYYDVADRSVVA